MKLYVPDPQKWVTFFERLRDGNTMIDQTGAGRRPRVIPIEDSKVSRERKQVTIRAVLPAEQTAARAESELKREGIKPEDVVDAFQSNTGKRKRKVAQIKSAKKSKTNKKESTKKAKQSDIFGT
jgi:pyruvate/2-oxoglutarate/acetoin dehydrogenase E1 component